VRQEIDVLKDEFVARSSWIESLSSMFEIHRSFSILLLLLIGFLVYRYHTMSKMWRTLGLALGAEIVIGIVLAYLDMPVIAQPLHLLMATLLFGVLWQLYSEREVELVA